MRTRHFCFSTLLAACLVALPAVAQVGHPAKGSWSGYWGPDKDDQHRMLLVIDWRNNQLSGTINPGRNAAKIENATLDVSDWTLTLEAEMPVARGSDQKAHFKATGKLENLGSWTNRTYSGTYKLGDETGTFKVTLN
jgi:hypothetical protein